MYEVLNLGRKHNLSMKCLLSLFDIMVKPILRYGREIWGFGNNDVLEKRPLRNMTILVLSMLTFSFQVKQYL
jgi:hypothetical protein